MLEPTSEGCQTISRQEAFGEAGQKRAGDYDGKPDRERTQSDRPGFRCEPRPVSPASLPSELRFGKKRVVDGHIVPNLGNADRIDVAVLDVTNPKRKVGTIDRPIVIHIRLNQIVAVVSMENVIHTNNPSRFYIEIDL